MCSVQCKVYSVMGHRLIGKGSLEKGSVMGNRVIGKGYLEKGNNVEDLARWAQALRIFLRSFP